MLRPLFVSFGALALLTGLAYPAALTGLARLTFPRQAQGSLLVQGGQVRASRLVAQATEDPRYFWCRPSPTAPFPTCATPGTGSTLASSDPAFKAALEARIQKLRASDPQQAAPIPLDLVTASASGLDPDLSPEGARWQVPRIARARQVPESVLLALVQRHVQPATLGLLGAPRVNVHDLNAALEALGPR